MIRGVILRAVSSFLVGAAAFMSVAAQTDDSQTELRLNPEIELNMPVGVDISKYPFLHLDDNRIEMNGADWSRLADIFTGAKTGDNLFSVIYLGDSHIQADFGGDMLRERLMSQSRPAGRGIAIPYRLASTNQPNDYTISTKTRLKTSKLLRQPWVVDMPFTGVGVQPVADNHTFCISSKRRFSLVNILYNGDGPEVSEVKDGDKVLPHHTLQNNPGKLSLCLDRSVESLDITLNSVAGTTYAGFELLSDTVGTVVHSIGNNGATYGSYVQISDMGRGLSSLQPDLIIIALGTNEAFGKATDTDIKANIDALVCDIRKNCEDAQLLLVGPAECYRKTYRWVRRKGRRRRVSSTVVNARVKGVRNAIREYAAGEGIPYYDHYEVAGGDGSAAKMKAGGILGKDGIHYTVAGYQLWGLLLADAILAELLR